MRITLLPMMLLFASTGFAERHELGLTLGALSSPDPAPSLRFCCGNAMQANYGYRFLGGDFAALYGEVHFLANGQRVFEGGGPTATRDVATAYVTPGVRVKFVPKSPVAPYFAIGGGYALYEQSHLRNDGQPNDAPRFLHRGAFDFGGGVDVKVWRWLGLRGEIRDFYTGRPGYNIASIRGGQHNVVAGGGIVFRWGE